MQETRAGVPIGVLDENVQRLQQIDDHSGAIDQSHKRFDGVEACLTNLQTMMEEMMKRQLVVEQPAVQPRQEEQTSNRV